MLIVPLCHTCSFLILPCVLQDMTELAALVEADLQKLNAAAKEAAAKKAVDDAKVLEREQVRFCPFGRTPGPSLCMLARPQGSTCLHGLYCMACLLHHALSLLCIPACSMGRATCLRDAPSLDLSDQS